MRFNVAFPMPMMLVALVAICMVAGQPTATADDISTGSWDTVDDDNTTAPPNGWPAGMFPNEVEPTARAMMGGVARWWERQNATLRTTYASSTYNIATSNTVYPTRYKDGEIYCAKSNHASGGGDLLAINALDAKPMYIVSGSGQIFIPANAIGVDQIFCVAYDAAIGGGVGGWQVFTNTSTPTAGAATKAQMEAATDNTVYATPSNGKFYPGTAKAYVEITYNGATAQNVSSFNVSSLSRTSTGIYTATLTGTFTHGWASCTGFASGTPLLCAISSGDITGATPTITVKFTIISAGTQLVADPDRAIVVIYGDLT